MATSGTTPKRKFYKKNENLPTAATEYEWTPEMAAELEKCKDDILHFAENYFYIVNMDKGKMKIELYNFQRDLLRKIKENKRLVVLASRQIGKALALNTPIPTPTGWTTMGDLHAGSVIYDEKGNPCTVTHAHDIMHNRKCYKVTFDNGDSIIADAEHNWFTQSRAERKRKTICKGSVKTTEQIFNSLSRIGGKNHRIRKHDGLTGVNRDDLLLDPYLLGLWLGDGSTNGAKIHCHHEDAPVYMGHIKQYPVVLKKYGNSNAVQLNVNGATRSRAGRSMLRDLKDLNVFKNKHIPGRYLLADKVTRLHLLQGLMDTDGFVRKDGMCEITSSRKELFDGIVELVHSLGYKAKISSRPTTHKLSYRIRFKTSDPVCRLPRKLVRLGITTDLSAYHYIVKVEPVESEPVRCITVDSDSSLFLAGKSMVPTHNSTLMCIYALWMASFHKDKRIILLANKEKTAVQLFARIRMAYEMLPNWLKPGIDGPYGQTEMKLATGSSIMVAATSSTTIRGDSANVIILDEFAFVENNIVEEFWESVMPVISSSKTASVFIVSTPNGTQNKFYELYSAAERKDPNTDWVHARVDWWDVPGRDEEWKKRMISDLGSMEAFSQEFGNVFIETGKCAIDKDLIDELRKECKDPEYCFTETAVGFELQMEPNTSTTYKIWELPQKNRCYVIGADVSEGIGKAASVAMVFDITDTANIKQVAQYHNRFADPLQFANRLYQIAKQYGSPNLLVERNNAGAQVINALYLTYGYHRLVTYNVLKGAEGSQSLGVYSHTNARYNGIMNWRYWMNFMRAVKIYDIATIQEIETFQRKDNGTWSAINASGAHDDRVFAMIWALFILDITVAHRYLTVIDVDDQGKPKKVVDENSENVSPEFIFNSTDSKSKSMAPAIIMGLPQSTAQGAEIWELEQEGWQIYR